MEAEALALAISKHIQIEIGLRWKMISLGTRTKIPTEQQVRALHVEVAVENRLAAQKALLAVYGRHNIDSYPNGIRLKFALPIGAAYNLSTRAKLEKLRSRQQLWSQTYQKGQTWEITQLHFHLTNTLTLRQALTQILSTTDNRFPLFHSVDRSLGKNAGIIFQFLPELESEARLMISNLLPYLYYHHGEKTKQCFTPSAVDRLAECKWDPDSNTIIGAYDDEIDFLDDSDIMAQYISSKTVHTPTASNHTNSTIQNPSQSPKRLTTTAYGNDEYSVSTLGNNTSKKWTPANHPSLPSSHNSIPNTIAPSPKPSATSDDRSIGSISTIHTRLNSIEGQYHQLSGAVPWTTSNKCWTYSPT